MFTENLYSEPGTVFVFCTSHLMEKPIRVPSRHRMRLPRNAKCEVIEMEKYLKALLPKTCYLYAVAADGVVGTSKDLKTTKEMEQTEAISCLCLPKQDKLSFHHFILDNHTSRVDDSGSSVFDASKVSHIPTGEKVGAILMFCDEYCLPEISYGLKSHFNEAVLAGGYVDHLLGLNSLHSYNGTEESDDDSILCVALCGENVHVRSVVIKEEVLSRSEVEQKIKSLKDCHLPEGRSFAFMFACIGRGNAYYQEHNVESQVFRKIFPNTPIFGFFGNGEIGFNSLKEYVPKMTDVNNVDRTTPSTKYLPKLHHAYTTILVLVSIT
ncbi:hypothetical protein FSP39_019976 [Pinctada imbricata]|uniref:FIST C-domain domain-containing protein n=1 Tax=Pinctada imbricata TaxID=66713 RepID=A0AA89BXX9_PINIB|nr:hypothetical protein FSP39_019976 [Pinctada imbricata]